LTHFLFGHTRAGENVTAYCLENRQGATAVIMDYGATVLSLCVPNAQGGLTDVVLGYDTVTEYEENGGYAGAAIGRVANRIGKSAFTLGGKLYRLARNDGENHLHGGLRGFDKVLWHAEAEGNALVFSRVSPDGEENYPGNLAVKITYELTDGNELRFLYDAVSDADTLVNLTNHSYFNLNGKGDLLDHTLQVFSDRFTENDMFCVPTGRLLSTAGTPFDFREPKTLGRDIDAPDIQLLYGNGYDHNFILSDSFSASDPPELKKAAILYGGETGISMTTTTTLPGIQVYSGNWLTPRNGKNGIPISKRGAVCLETQVWPNAAAYAHFPSPVLRADEHYHTETVYRFEVNKSGG
jgi:aldose 1-epimerase